MLGTFGNIVSDLLQVGDVVHDGDLNAARAKQDPHHLTPLAREI